MECLKRLRPAVFDVFLVVQCVASVALPTGPQKHFPGPGPAQTGGLCLAFCFDFSDDDETKLNWSRLAC